MEMMQIQNFKKSISTIDESQFYKEYRINCFNKMRSAPQISFKYGINIIVKPKEFDINTIRPKFYSEIKKNITADKKVKIFSSSSIPKNIKEDEKIKLFLSEDWFKDYENIDYFNQAFSNDFVFIEIPKNTEIEKPVYIDYEYSKTTLTNIFILAGENSKCKVVVNKSSLPNIYLSETVRIYAKENTQLDFISLQNLDKSIVNIQKRKALVRKDAVINWIDVCLGSNYTRSSIVTDLKEQGANAKNTVLYLSSDNQNFDIYTASIHIAENTSSNIITKGVLNDESKVLSRGLVRIEQNAYGSDGYENQEALLLSEKAEANAIPNLEINNHDVKCSHGSSVGQLDEEKIFYLQSRGLNKKQARKQIIEGYFMPILNLLEEELKNKIYKSITNSL